MLIRENQRIKQMFCLKFLMFSMMGGYPAELEDQPKYEERIKRVIIFYNELMRRDGEKLSHDDEFVFLAKSFFSRETRMYSLE